MARKQGRVRPERVRAARRRREALLITWAFIILALLLLGLLAYTLVAPDPRAALAACLAEHGAVMYGSDQSEAVQEQKRLFGAAFQKVAYVNCAYSTACRDEEISVEPTWMIEGEHLEGVQPLALLAQKTGCSEGET